MDVFLVKFLLLLSPSIIAGHVDSETRPEDPTQAQPLSRYVVFPGVDAEPDEVAEWSYGFASPFNVFFGPKPYVLGWLGEAPFGPEGEDEYPGEYEEEDIEEEDEEEEDIDEGYPDYEKS